MAETADYLIIGGGIVGITIAHHLSQGGNEKVVLCERRALASGTTAFSGAMCGQQASLTDTISKLAVRALNIYENFEERVGGSCGFINNGLLVARKDLDAEEYAARARKNGSEVEVLSAKDIARIYPELDTHGVEKAAFFPRTGCVDSFRTVHSFADAARKNGAELKEFTPVTAIKVKNGKIDRVQTSEGEIAPGKVILACGPWSHKVAALAGVQLPIETTQVGVSFFRQPPGFYSKPPVAWVEGIGGLVPWHGGNFRVLCDDRTPRITTEPDPVEATCPNWMVEKCATQIRHHLPKMRYGIFQGAYRTCYDDTPDLKPLIGFIPGVDNLFIDCGWSGKGFKFSVALGEYLANWIRSGSCDIDLKPWMADRFNIRAV